MTNSFKKHNTQSLDISSRIFGPNKEVWLEVSLCELETKEYPLGTQMQLDMKARQAEDHTDI